MLALPIASCGLNVGGFQWLDLTVNAKNLRVCLSAPALMSTVAILQLLMGTS